MYMDERHWPSDVLASWELVVMLKIAVVFVLTELAVAEMTEK